MELLFVAFIVSVAAWVCFSLYDKRRLRTINSNLEKNTQGRVIETRYRIPSLKNKMGENYSALVDYTKYEMPLKDKVINSLLAGVCLYFVGFIFYQNHILAFIISIFSLYYPRIREREIVEKRKQELSKQFKQALYSLSSALGAGKSVENAFREVTNDLRMLYPDPKTSIIKEFEVINHRIENGEPIEEAIQDLSRRAEIEDITSFADVFVICKRTGGDLVEVIRRTSNIISDKLDIQHEIGVLIAQKKLESKIISVIPLVFVGLLSISAPDYMAPLYQFGIGPIIMTISLLLIVAAFLLSKWIMNIKV